MRTPLAALAILSVALAGCVQPPVEPAGVETGAALERVRELLADVPCEAEVGSETSANLLPLSLSPPSGVMHAELDALGDLLLAATYDGAGFDVFDVADASAPRLIASFDGVGGTALDVKWLPAGDAAVVGSDDGVVLVDMRDPASPVVASEWLLSSADLGGEAHMVDAHAIAGKEYVFIASSSGQGIMILERDGWELRSLVNYRHPVLAGGPIGPHDMTVLDDEILEKPIVYVANGFEGWLAVDVSDPASPAFLGGMINADPAQGYLHTIQAEKIGERRIVATVSELGVNAVKVWDATDLARPLLLGEWFADPARATLPNHNLQLLNGLLYVAHYGKGVFVFDLTKVGSIPYAGSLDLSPIARFAPKTQTPELVDAVAFWDVWDVVLVDGVLFVSEQDEGVHAVGFGCLAVGDAAQTSRG